MTDQATGSVVGSGATRNRAKELKFWKRVRKTNDCWVWKGWIGRGGYGRFRADGRIIAAHRIAYELTIGRIPSGLCVLHHCDNRLCVNPAHLWLGTRCDNNLDRDQKGHTARGERNGEAKATATLVKEIRERYKIGNLGTQSLAQIYGLSRRAVQHIVKGETWR